MRRTRPGTGVTRHTIVGNRKSDPSEPGPEMELRYFEIKSGAASRLEKHEHEHDVIVRRGLGYAVIGDTATEIGANDVVYVGPLELHQFVNRGDEAVWHPPFRRYLSRLFAGANARRARAPRSVACGRSRQTLRGLPARETLSHSLGTASSHPYWV